MAELLYSIRSIYSGAEFKDKEFRIPNYQRGYKWTKENIVKLLEDINNFKPKSDESFYCIQNITICEHHKDEEESEGKTEYYYNVVDGQQRLTTTFIILCFLNQQNLVRNKLVYEIRKSTKKFMDDYIVTRKCWDEGFTHTPKHLDEYYIINAALTIKEWIDINIPKDKREDFETKVLDRTKLIVNRINSKDEELTFTNLNGVKVPLDGADLIRAILITRSVHEAFSKENNPSLIKQYRIRMGIEIDSIAFWWENNDVYKFFGRFIPSKFQQIAKDRKFDRSSYRIDTLYMLFYLAKGEIVNNFSIDFFEQINYNDISKFHSAMTDWFENDRLYHYIGYLSANVSSNFNEIYNLWIKSPSRTDFETALVSKIQDYTRSLAPEKKESDTEKDNERKLLEKIGDIQFNWYHNEGLPKLLLLKDVITVLNANNIKRVPVDYQGVNDEDREHVGCQTPNDELIANKDAWISCIDSLKKLDVSSDALENLRDKIQKTDEITQETKKEIIASLSKFGINSIGNLVMLDKSVNRGYGNDGYTEKRLAIVNNYFNENRGNKRSRHSKNRHIRPQTLKVFITSNKNEWLTDDIQSTAQEFKEIIGKFLSK